MKKLSILIFSLLLFSCSTDASLKKENGSRAIGTKLDRNHPGYKSVLNGETYLGKAVLFGKEYMTKYIPIKINDKVEAIAFITTIILENIAVNNTKIEKLVESIGIAVDLCNSCPAKEACLQEGMQPNDLPFGIWGGILGGDRL